MIERIAEVAVKREVKAGIILDESLHNQPGTYWYKISDLNHLFSGLTLMYDAYTYIYMLTISQTIQYYKTVI